MKRPAFERLLEEIRAKNIDVIVVYKIDRLTRSLADFAKMVELFDERGVSFVSVTQQFNTKTSMGRLTLNVLLSVAQFEREVTGESNRDKIAASKKKGMWMGGNLPMGYDVEERELIINERDAETDGPQVITRHGDNKAGVLSIEEYLKLEAAQPDFKQYLLSGPKVDDFDIERPRDTGREIEL